MRLVLLGPPGAGKGTQAKVLSNKLRIPHISTGDIFREVKASESELGKKLSDYMNRGVLVPDEIVNQIVTDRLQRDDVKDAGFILDGYPRTRPQAEALDRALEDIGIHLDSVIYMKTSKRIILSRLTGRRICKACGSIFHIKNIPPKQEGVCDYCEGELYQRDDDKEDTVLKRLQVYEDQTKELIDYYNDREALQTVSGDLDVRQLYDVLYELFGKEGLL
ncbi:MAG: adenylate kinase [Candidatus Omnitrophica bacterium]|nr:adenylate kinase [Candidatus Omnitrophota bacterium]